jgi:CheY-like chemotaxis protein
MTVCRKPPGGQVLIVDDNPANMKLVAFLLSAKGYAVRTANSAAEALTELELQIPELILMVDIQLPGMDGLSLTRKLRSEPKTAGVIIVAVTAYAMKGDEEKALEAGCDGYITKPVDTRSLPAKIASYLEQGRRQGN